MSRRMGRMHSAPTRRATNAQVDLFGQTVAAGVHTREQSGELHSGVNSSIGLTSPQVADETSSPLLTSLRQDTVSMDIQREGKHDFHR